MSENRVDYFDGFDGFAPQELISGPYVLNDYYRYMSSEDYDMSYPISGDARLLWESKYKES